MVGADSTAGRRNPRRFTGRDRIATGLIAGVVVVYAGYLAIGSMWFVDTVRDMALVGLAGGFASRLIGGRAAFSPRWPAVLAAFATLGLGIVAMATGSGVVLAVFMAANVILCVAALVVQRRSGAVTAGSRESAGALR